MKSLVTIDQIRTAILSGDHTTEEWIGAVLADIQERDQEIGAFLSLTSQRAMDRARELDQKLAQGHTPGPLFGVPVSIKDNICMIDTPTTCGSKMLADFTAPYDATVIERLQAADAVLIGKTNMDEFAMGSSTENSAFQTTKNPWDTSRVPGGSSGGAAASVGAGFVPLALGSDTGGSVRQPAAFCGAVGLKPTYGLISRFGLIAYGSSLDQVGPLTTSVADAALALEILSGMDPKDATSSREPAKSYSEALGRGIEGLTVGLPKEFIGDGVDPAIVQVVKDTADLLESLGAKVVDVSMPFGQAALSAYYVIASAEASSNLARFDGIRYGHRPSDFTSTEDLMVKARTEGFGEEVKRRIMIGTYALSSGYYDAYYKKAQAYRDHIAQIYDMTFAKCDVILGPTSPVLPFKVGEKTDDPLSMYLADIFTVTVNMAGVPALSLPGGMVDQLPVGVQLTAPKYGEEVLFSMGYALEQALDLPKTSRK